MSDLLKRLQKAGSLDSVILSESKSFQETNYIDTGYPMLNLALSGRVDGGLTSGLTIFAGPSRHFKSNYMVMCMAAFQRANPDGVILFYNTESGTKKSYFEAYDIDSSRVLEQKPMDIEEFRFDIMQKLNELTEDSVGKVMIAVDSFGNIASKKEIQDSISGNAAADMTRAKQMKSLGRMITPYLSKFDIPAVGVNHVYETQEMFSKQVMSGGTGLMYSADTIIFVGRRQEKSGTELVGYNFDLSINKSRFVVEGRKFPITVTYEDGVKKYSGMLDLILELTDEVTQSGAWYTVKGEDKKVRRSDIENNSEFIDNIIYSDSFKELCNAKFTLTKPKISDILVDVDI